MDGHRAVTRSNLSSGRGVGQDPEVVDDPELDVLGLLADDPELDDPELDDPEPDDPDADDPEPDALELDPEPPPLFGAGRESVR